MAQPLRSKADNDPVVAATRCVGMTGVTLPTLGS